MALEVLNNKKYDILDPMVEDIHNKCIRMDNKEKQALVERFKRVIENKFINEMKEVDPLFSQIYNRTGYTGSFYEGLRVGEATEYDLNLILKPALKIKPDKHGCPPGFISVVIDEKYESLPKLYKYWAKSDGARLLLDPTSVSNWLQGVVYRAVRKINAEAYLFDDCEIQLVRKSGPAWTLVIVSHKYPMKTIDVDLVPVLEFPCSQWPVPRSRCGSYSETWFAVPKPPRGGISSDWRLSFPKQESKLISGLEYLKYTLRLLKRARDQFHFNAIASYYIKTLFLWEVEERDKYIWVKNRRGRLFIYMLIRLRDALLVENISFFWDEKCNLIEHVNSHTLINFHGRLKRFLKDIDRLIDTKNHEQLKRFISDTLSTPEEVMEEQVTAQESSCTIL